MLCHVLCHGTAAKVLLCDVAQFGRDTAVARITGKAPSNPTERVLSEADIENALYRHQVIVPPPPDDASTDGQTFTYDRFPDRLREDLMLPVQTGGVAQARVWETYVAVRTARERRIVQHSGASVPMDQATCVMVDEPLSVGVAASVAHIRPVFPRVPHTASLHARSWARGCSVPPTLSPPALSSDRCCSLRGGVLLALHAVFAA